MTPETRRTLTGYLDAVAAGTPTPGGGSVAAVVGAQAAALGEMVANLTDPEKLDGEEGGVLATARDRLTALRAELLRAAVADEAAYDGYRRAASLPKATDAERAARAAAMQTALRTAIEAPLAAARAAADVAALLVPVATIGKRTLLSDAALAALLAETALAGALLYVDVNLALLHDQGAAEEYRRQRQEIAARGRAAAAAARTQATCFD
ncbi:MAG: cyclodeaminase/cyclohydrolase family protein [Thermomicrobiales bacterium]